MPQLTPEEFQALPEVCKQCRHGRGSADDKLEVESQLLVDTGVFALECADKLSDDLDAAARQEACNRRYIRAAALLVQNWQMGKV